MRFRLEDYTEPHTVMHCMTKDEAVCFTRFLHEHDRRWISGKSYDKVVHFDKGEKTAYNFNMGVFDSVDFYSRHDYQILKFSDFDWPGFNDRDVVYDDSLDSFISGF